jgi:hypothetical protein
MDQAVNRFDELSTPRAGELPGDAQRRAQAEFPAALARGPLRVWSPDAASGTGRCLVLGVATWSRYDLRLLDLISGRLSKRGTDCSVYVFDIDTVLAPDEMERRVPGQRVPHHSPVVGLWHDGRFVESECGYAGRHLVYRALGIEPAQSDEIVLHARTPSPA